MKKLTPLLIAALAASAQAAAAATVAEIAAMRPAEVARLFLPRAQAATIINAKIASGGMLPPGFHEVTLSAAASPIRPGVCGRDYYRFYVTAKRDGGPAVAADPDTIRPSPEITLSKRCDKLAGRAMAKVQPGTDAKAAVDMLAWLDDIRGKAKQRGPMRFDALCDSKIKLNRCSKGAMFALATLPLEQAFAIGIADHNPAKWQLYVPDKVGRAAWTVDVDRSGARPEIAMQLDYPPPF